MGKKYCITGGAGYLGYHIGRRLLKSAMDDSGDNQVILFDRLKPNDIWKDVGQSDVLSSFTFVLGNVCNLTDLESAFVGVDCVIHTAAFGLSNTDQLPDFWDEVEEINVNGTKNVIEACRRQNVAALVYTSTNNVVFQGREIIDGDESLPYTPTFKHSDHYSRTKAIAEQMILLVNGKCLIDGHGQLRTCALRLAGLVGPKETRHIPRTINYIRSGIILAKFWYNEGLSDFVLIHNAVEAHMLAANALMDDKRKNKISGQPYFISDGQPVNTFEYFLDIADVLGYRTPKQRIPAIIVWIFVLFMEIVPTRLLIALNVATMTRTEFLKLVITHYFSIEKAKRELDYNPTRPNDQSEIIEWLSSQRTESTSLTTKPSKPHVQKGIRFKFLSVLLLLFALVFILLQI